MILPLHIPRVQSQRVAVYIYPNPLRSGAMISYSVAGRLGSKEYQYVELKVYDVTGREVKTLASGMKTPGHYELVWDGLDSRGLKCPAGVYVVRLHSDEFDANQRVILLR